MNYQGVRKGEEWKEIKNNKVNENRGMRRGKQCTGDTGD